MRSRTFVPFYLISFYFSRFEGILRGQTEINRCSGLAKEIAGEGGCQRKQSEVLPNRTHPPHIDRYGKRIKLESEFRGGPGEAEGNVL